MKPRTIDELIQPYIDALEGAAVCDNNPEEAEKLIILSDWLRRDTYASASLAMMHIERRNDRKNNEARKEVLP